MHAEKLVPAVIAAVAVVCLLFAGRAHGQGYGQASSKQVEEPAATNQNDGYPTRITDPAQLFMKPGFSLYAPSKLHPAADSTFTGKLGGYLPQPTTTTSEPEPEPAAETTTEPATETTTEPEPEAEPESAPATTAEPEQVTPTAPGQGDFYRTGETPTAPETPATPTAPETPATPSSPASDSYSGGGGASASKEKDDDGEPVEGLDAKTIANILKEHNLFRAKEGEGPLTWNATVAKYAQNYANERKGDCTLKHSVGSPYGENLMEGGGKAWTWRHTVDQWSDEKKNYHYSTNTCDPGKMCGHYTAVVWKDTTSVGCGRVTCAGGNTFMVCSYYPPGNYYGEKPY